MGDGNLPANAWSTLNTVAESDAASTTTFAGPGIATVGTALGAFAQRESGNVPVDRAMLAHPPAGSDVSAAWTEPVPHEAASANGIALAASDAGVFATTPAGVWYAPILSGADDLTARVLAASYCLSSSASVAEVELDNHDGALTGPGGAFPRVAPGATLELRPGYLSGAGEAFEYGVNPRFTVERVSSAYRAGRATVTLHCVGPWEMLDRWRPPQAWQAVAGTLTRGAIIERIAGRAGLTVYAADASAAWSATSPAFAVAAGESGLTALHRLLAVVPDQVRPDAASLTIVGVSPSDLPGVAYGGPGDHPIRELTAELAPAPANWIRLTGPDRYADAHDFASLALDGPRLRLLRNLDATTDTKASGAAANALRRDAVAEPAGRMVAPFHCGQQLYDVITVTCAPLGLEASVARVVAVELDYRRGARFDSILTLGGL